MSTHTRPSARARRVALVALPLAAVALSAAACSGGTSSYGSPAEAGTPASAPPASAPAESTAPAVQVRTGPLGRYLTDAGGRALYLFAADVAGTSTCEGACARAWPALTTTGKPTAGPGTDGSALGTVARRDGTTQVTYSGHPLYTFVKDTAPGRAPGASARRGGSSRPRAGRSRPPPPPPPPHRPRRPRPRAPRTRPTTTTDPAGAGRRRARGTTTAGPAPPVARDDRRRPTARTARSPGPCGPLLLAE